MVLSWKFVKEIKGGLLFLRMARSVIQRNSLDKICFRKLKITEELTKVQKGRKT